MLRERRLSTCETKLLVLKSNLHMCSLDMTRRMLFGVTNKEIYTNTTTCALTRAL